MIQGSEARPDPCPASTGADTETPVGRPHM
jgi:hypothetical protein